MKVLIGYSRCPYTVAAFKARGHDVWTCDLRPADHPNHLQCDVWEVLRDKWDLAILHPMCTYLTVSAAWAYGDGPYHQKPGPDVLLGAERRAAREEALDNFRRLLALPYPKAIENPARSFVCKAIRRPDMVLQPYEFGDDASKATGFWTTHGLSEPLRDPAKFVQPRLIEYRGKIVKRWANQSPCGAPSLPPSKDRWLIRSDTYPGIAKAMAEAWG